MVLNGEIRRARVRAYYENNPLMVSSPFGGIDGINEPLLEQVLDRLDIRLEGQRILDVGCGRGFAGDFVRKSGGTYSGVDFVQSRGGFPFVMGDAAKLPFADGSFDGVFCIDAFEHFPEAGGAASEFYRVLRPGGWVFLSVPNYSNVAGVVKFCCERWGAYRPMTWAPFRRWQPQEYERPLTAGFVRRAFRGAGFVRMRRIGYGAEAGLGLFPWVAHPQMPEWAQFRIERLFAAAGPAIVRVWPGASLHQFWKIER
ncbi:MAG TPA: class I SAM-dependent methyltransferase [Candidatus Bathyarchaeia archaeon]|nr:class I SAM-dependent methyltransferase [Candidatus Bathyarchaeia archaeon]